MQNIQEDFKGLPSRVKYLQTLVNSYWRSFTTSYLHELTHQLLYQKLKHSRNLLRSNRLEMFCKKGVLKNFTKVRGKHLCQSLFFKATLLIKRLWHRWFPMNFVKFLRTPFFIKHLRWLLLFIDWWHGIDLWRCKYVNKSWQLGKVNQVVVGKDGKIIRAKVIVVSKSGTRCTFYRPVLKLIQFEIKNILNKTDIHVDK